MKTKNIRILVLAAMVFGVYFPECLGQYGTLSSRTRLNALTRSEPVVVQVSVEMPSACDRVTSWGEPRFNGTVITVDAVFSTSGTCVPSFRTEFHDYKLGLLVPGPYNFIFESMGSPVKTLDFFVPLLLSASASEGASRVDFKWYSDTNAWYRLEQRTDLVNDSWTPLTEWLPGNGGLMMTNTMVATGQGQKFYRLVGSYSPPVP